MYFDIAGLTDEKLGDYNYVPLLAENGDWFRLEYEAPVIYGRKYGRVTADLHLVDGAWVIASIYHGGYQNGITPAAREWFTKYVTKWANENANQPTLKIARQNTAKRERLMRIDQAQRDVEKTRLAHQEAMNKLMAANSLALLGVDCPHCGCTIGPDVQSSLFNIDPSPCPYCKGILPEETVAEFHV